MSPVEVVGGLAGLAGPTLAEAVFAAMVELDTAFDSHDRPTAVTYIDDTVSSSAGGAR